MFSLAGRSRSSLHLLLRFPSCFVVVDDVISYGIRQTVLSAVLVGNLGFL